MSAGQPLRIVGAELDANGEARFRSLFEDHFRSVLGYALRRSSNASDAADVAADTMLTAWRRLDDVPSGAQTLPWLYGVARKMLANQRRARGRRDRLSERLRHSLPFTLPLPGEEHPEVRSAIDRLEPDAREILRLAIWESLTGDEIAAVLGITPAAVRTRLHRARLRLRAALTDIGEL